MEKTYLIVGLGVSGVSVVDVLAARGAHVVTVDDKKSADYTVSEINEGDFNFSSFDCIITSPGFKPSTPFIEHARVQNVPVISDVELAWKLHNEQPSTSRQTWIGITGTNGKTTTTEMTTAIMTAAGRQAQAVGNIGNPISTAAVNSQLDTLVAELSSFQMHYTQSLELTCAAITNLADDHLDWHGGFENYAHDKAKVYVNAQKVIVYNADDERVTQQARYAYEQNLTHPQCLCVGFTLATPQFGQIGIEDGWIVNRSELATQNERIAPVRSFTHLSESNGTIYPHLLADALCALCLSLGAGVSEDVAVASLQAFCPSGHRIETVAQLDRDKGTIRFVDDSKATNAHAAAASLSSFGTKSVVWIAGGLAKGALFDELVKAQKDVIKAAIIIGEDQTQMLNALRNYAPEIPLTVIDPSSSSSLPIMKQAVEAAGEYAKIGDIVLMAPACASMDQFVSYADRGNQFAQYSREWVAAHGE